MILNLRIKNIALIDEVEVNFAPGLNVLSGETGAGKSIVVDSIGFLLGGRVSRDLIRAGADFAAVEGVIDCPPLAKEGLFELGIDAADGELHLSRLMSQDTGKSVCRINGRTVTVAMLKSAAELLVDLHGQHEHQSLLDPLRQLAMLDGFCGEELAKPKRELGEFLTEYRELSRRLKKLAAGASEEQVEIWRFQLGELEKAALKPDEEENLTAKRNRLGSLEKLSKSTSAIVGLLYSGFFEGRAGLSAVDSVAKAAAFAAQIAKIDSTKENLHTALVDIQTQLAEITRDFRDYDAELDADPQELDKIETRLDAIYRIKQKYGGSVEAALKKRDEIAKKLDSLEFAGLEISQIEAKRKQISKEIAAVCGRISTIRTARAEEISRAITEILKDIGMQNAKFAIQITRKTSFGPDGNDEVEFLISPNPGEPEKPLRKIASGGEMSRIMLAIKTIMTDRISTVIFDEVDTGISGRTAQKVAEKLIAVSRTRQILCITHLPQIAAMADTHFLIEKAAKPHFSESAKPLFAEDASAKPSIRPEAGAASEAPAAPHIRTVTTVAPLSHEYIIAELARLIGGTEITSATFEAARQMKAQADGLKTKSS